MSFCSPCIDQLVLMRYFLYYIFVLEHTSQTASRGRPTHRRDTNLSIPAPRMHIARERIDDSRWPDPAVQGPRAIALPLAVHSTNDTRDISQRRDGSIKDTQTTVLPLVARSTVKANGLSQRCNVAAPDPQKEAMAPSIHSIKGGRGVLSRAQHA